MRRLRLSLCSLPLLVGLFALLPTAACGNDGPAGDGDGDGDGDPGDGDGDGDGDAFDIPTEAGALGTWLDDAMYSTWPAESAPHAGTNGSPHGQVKVFINPALDASLAAGNTTHPVGAASVKELYDAGGAVVGHAVEVKVTEGTTGDDWLWFLRNGGAVQTNGTGVGFCVNCHAAGVDHFTTTYPLQ